jgi:hypothetical protein
MMVGKHWLMHWQGTQTQLLHAAWCAALEVAAAKFNIRVPQCGLPLPLNCKSWLLQLVHARC